MATDPGKTPLEVVYGGIATLIAVSGYFFGKRKQRKEYLDYEPVPKIDFEEFKKNMDARFKEIDQKQLVTNATVLAGIQDLRVALASVTAQEQERKDWMTRLEQRLNSALDPGGV